MPYREMGDGEQSDVTADKWRVKSPDAKLRLPEEDPHMMPPLDWDVDRPIDRFFGGLRLIVGIGVLFGFLYLWPSGFMAVLLVLLMIFLIAKA